MGWGRRRHNRTARLSRSCRAMACSGRPIYGSDNTLQPQQPNGDAPQRRGVYLLTHPRSASNLFQTMMAKQPGYQNSGYKLFDAGFTTLVELDKGKLSEWSEEEQEKLYDSFRVAFGKLEDELDDCAKNVSFTSVLLFSNG